MYCLNPPYKRKAILKRDKLKVVSRDKLVCAQCKLSLHLSINKNKQISLVSGAFHHIVPMVYGGLNVAENICILCKACHLTVHSGDETKEKYILMYEKYITEGLLM